MECGDLPPLLKRRQGAALQKVLRGKVTVLEGEWQPKRCVVLEFSSVADTQRWWNSPDYAEAKELRHESATTSMIVVEGL